MPIDPSGNNASTSILVFLLTAFNHPVKFRGSELANQMESESFEFEDVDFGESSSSLISEVKDMGVEEMVVILSWGSR